MITSYNGKELRGIDEDDPLYSPDMKNKYVPALVEILTDVQTAVRGKMNIRVFGETILPLLMSKNEDEQKLGQSRYIQAANNNPFNEVELVNDLNQIVFILPPPMARIPSIQHDAREAGPLSRAKMDFMLAQSEDMMFGREPSSLRSATGDVYRSVAHEFEHIANPTVLIAWDQIVTYFGYPSFFKPEEREYLISKGLMTDLTKEGLVSQGTSRVEEVKKVETKIEETYEEDDWEI